MGLDPFLQKGMASAKGSGGLGRKVLNILGGAEGDPSQHSGMTMRDRGMSQAKNPGGLGKRAIRMVIKSYLGGGLGELSGLGSLSSTLGQLGSVGEAVGSVMDTVGGAVDSVGGPLKGALGDIPMDASGVQDLLTDQLGLPVGPANLQKAIMDKTGIPLGPGAIVDKVMGPDMLNANPVYGEAINEMLENRDPRRKRGNQPYATISELAPYGPGPQASSQPAFVPPAATGADNRAGVRNLVSQRFGEGSPMTQYIGRYQDGGQYRTGKKRVRAVMDLDPNETVTVTPVGMTPPPNPNPDNQSAVQQAVAGDARQSLGKDIHQPLVIDRGTGALSLPEAGTGIHIPGTDIFYPNKRGATTAEKVFSWLGFIASKGTGKSPGSRINEAGEWNLGQDYRNEIERHGLQTDLEGRVSSLLEQRALNRMRSRIGVPRQETYKHGQTRVRPAGVKDQTGQGRRMLQGEVFHELKGWVPDQYGAYPAQGEEAPHKTTHKIYRTKNGRVEFAETTYDPETRTQRFRIWDPITNKMGFSDTPTEQNWVARQAGWGAAALQKQAASDDVAIKQARSLKKMIEDNPGISSGDVEFKNLSSQTQRRFFNLLSDVSRNHPVGDEYRDEWIEIMDYVHANTSKAIRRRFDEEYPKPKTGESPR